VELHISGVNIKKYFSLGENPVIDAHPPILLVEDNPVDVDLTLRAFSRRKLANPVIVARDGEEALAWIPRWQAGETKPAVILLDLNMPRVDGLTVLRQLKSQPELQRIPVVILTTSKEDRDINTAYDLGANSYIVKPVDFNNFMEVAQQIELYWCVTNEKPH
jgi:CheY-like chemotaxis protein